MKYKCNCGAAKEVADTDPAPMCDSCGVEMMKDGESPVAPEMPSE